MGKRSDFERRENNYYPTPERAVLQLVDHITINDIRYVEPCAGNGALISHLSKQNAVCVGAWDIEPKIDKYPEGELVQTANIFDIDLRQYCDDHNVDYIITNPPWSRDELHDMIVYFSDIRPTWLLFDANWLNTKQARSYRDRLSKYAPVGRLKWIEGTSQTGKDDSAWYLFTAPEAGRHPQIMLHGQDFTLPRKPRTKK